MFLRCQQLWEASQKQQTSKITLATENQKLAISHGVLLHLLITQTSTSILVLTKIQFPNTFLNSTKHQRYSPMRTPLPKLIMRLLALMEPLQTASAWMQLKTLTN